jgi:hypothetical protein
MSQADDEAFARDLRRMLEHYGAAPGEPLVRSVQAAVENMRDALEQSADDGASLSALDVVRIRANKLFASSVPAAVYRDVGRRTAAQAHIFALARSWLGAHGERGNWFGPTASRRSKPDE